MSGSGNKPLAIIATGAAAGLGLVYARGDFDKFGFVDSMLSVLGALVFSVVFFGGIHLLLKKWDRWRAR